MNIEAWYVFCLEYPENRGFWTEERKQAWKKIKMILEEIEKEYNLRTPFLVSSIWKVYNEGCQKKDGWGYYGATL